jgi:hypothetical protein
VSLFGLLVESLTISGGLDGQSNPSLEGTTHRLISALSVPEFLLLSSVLLASGISQQGQNSGGTPDNFN